MTELNIKYYEFLFNVRLQYSKYINFFSRYKTHYAFVSIPTKEDNDHIVSEECQKIIEYFKSGYDTKTHSIIRMYMPFTCSFGYIKRY